MRPQKGSGQARLGSSRAPTMVGGGVAHGPENRDHSFKIGFKVKNLAIRIALSAKFKEGNLFVVKDLELESHKTQYLANLMETKWPAIQHDRISVIHGENELDPNFLLAARNIYGFDFYSPPAVNVYDLVLRHRLMVTETGLAELEARLMRPNPMARVNFVVDRPIVKLAKLMKLRVSKRKAKQVTALKLAREAAVRRVSKEKRDIKRAKYGRVLTMPEELAYKVARTSNVINMHGNKVVSRATQ